MLNSVRWNHQLYNLSTSAFKLSRKGITMLCAFASKTTVQNVTFPQSKVIVVAILLATTLCFMQISERYDSINVLHYSSITASIETSISLRVSIIAASPIFLNAAIHAHDFIPHLTIAIFTLVSRSISRVARFLRIRGASLMTQSLPNFSGAGETTYSTGDASNSAISISMDELHWILRVLLATLFIASNASMLSLIDEYRHGSSALVSSTNFIVSFFSILTFEAFTSASLILIYVSYRENQILKSNWRSALASVTLTVGALCGLSSALIYTVGERTRSALYDASCAARTCFIMLLVSALLLLKIFARVAFITKYKCKRSLSGSAAAAGTQVSSHCYEPNPSTDNTTLAYLLLLFGTIVAVMVAYFSTYGFNFSEPYVDEDSIVSSAHLLPNLISTFLYIQTAFSLILGTISYMEMCTKLKQTTRLLREKKTFLQYISHEIRTPLNTVTVGISCVKDDLRKIAAQVTRYAKSTATSANDGSYHTGTTTHRDIIKSLRLLKDDTIKEVETSCQSALTILNELLMSDKMESGKLQLEIEYCSPKLFFLDAIRPFMLQAKNKSISLIMEFSGKRVLETCAHSYGESLASEVASENPNTVVDKILDTYSLGIDRCKMSQVIRNLISNALKFTPEEGTIKVVIKRKAATQGGESAGGGGAVTKPVSIRTPAQTSKRVQSSRAAGDLRSKLLPFRMSSGKTTAVAVAPSPVAEMAVVAAVNRIAPEVIDVPITPIPKVAPDVAWNVPEAEEEPEEDKPQFLRVEVIDSGAGISPENQLRLFKKYVQFEAAKLQKGGGTGLGLWISKGIVEMHGGIIGACSAGEGLGTTFFFELPLLPVPPASLGNIPSRFHSGNFSDIGSVTGNGKVFSMRSRRGSSCAPSIGQHPQLTPPDYFLSPINRDQRSHPAILRGNREDEEGDASFRDCAHHIFDVTSMEHVSSVLSGGFMSPAITRSTRSGLQSPAGGRSRRGSGVVKLVSSYREANSKKVKAAANGVLAEPSPTGNNQEVLQALSSNNMSTTTAGVSQRPYGANRSSSPASISLKSSHQLQQEQSKRLPILHELCFSPHETLKSAGAVASPEPAVVYSGKDDSLLYLEDSRGGRSTSCAAKEQEGGMGSFLIASQSTSTAHDIQSEDICATAASSLDHRRRWEKLESVDRVSATSSTMMDIRGSNGAIHFCSPAFSTAVSAIQSPNPISDAAGGRIGLPAGKAGVNGFAVAVPAAILVGESTTSSFLDSSTTIIDNRRIGVTVNSRRESARSANDTLPHPQLRGRGLPHSQSPSQPVYCGSQRLSVTADLSKSRPSTELDKLSGNSDVSQTNRASGGMCGEGATVLRSDSKAVEDGTAHDADGTRRRRLPSATQRLTILIVDDASSNRKMVARLLRDIASEILEACDGKDCLRIMQDADSRGTPIDIILMDDNMPNLSGPETARILRFRGYSGLICGVTGNVMPSDVKRFKDHGASCVLSKPLNVELLKYYISQYQSGSVLG